MKSEAEVEARLALVSGEDRLKGPRASFAAVAVRALTETRLETEVRVLRWVLELMAGGD